MEEEEEVKLVNIQEMAELLGVNKDFLYRTVSDTPPVGTYRVGRHWRFDPETVLEHYRVETWAS